MRLHARNIQLPHHIYAACILTTPLVTCVMFVCLFLHCYHIRLHAHGIRRLHNIYVACIITVLPIICSLVCLYTATICACMLTIVYHYTPYIQPTCSHHFLSFVHLIVSTQQPYAPTCSRYSTITLHI